MSKYVLNEQGQPVLEPDFLKWARWYENADRHVADERIGGVRISTVFLSLSVEFGNKPPELWETMVFGGPLNGQLDRCTGTREQAEAMHQRMVQTVKGGALCS